MLIGGLLIPVLALLNIGDGNIISGIDEVYSKIPEKFNVIGSNDSVLPFNSVINSAATIFSIDIYKVHINKEASEEKLVRVGKICSTILSVFAILVAPLMGNAPQGLYQLMQTLNGFFYIPLGAIMIAGFFL